MPQSNYQNFTKLPLLGRMTWTPGEGNEIKHQVPHYRKSLPCQGLRGSLGANGPQPREANGRDTSLVSFG